MRRRTLVLVTLLVLVLGVRAVTRALRTPEPSPDPATADVVPQPIATADVVEPALPSPLHHADVHCSVEGATRDPLWGDLYEAEPPLGPDANRRHSVRIEQGWLVFRPLHQENIGILSIHGFRDAKLAWIDGACTASILLEPQPLTTLAIHVLLPEHIEGRFSAAVRPAGNPTEGGRMGDLVEGRVELHPPPGEVLLEVSAEIGRAYGIIHEEELTVPETAEVPIEIDLRDLPPLGWVDFPVNPDLTSPILEPGEKVMTADGRPPHTLRDGAIGPADQPVVIEVIAEDGTVRTVEVPRRR